MQSYIHIKIETFSIIRDTVLQLFTCPKPELLDGKERKFAEFGLRVS